MSFLTSTLPLKRENIGQGKIQLGAVVDVSEPTHSDFLILILHINWKKIAVIIIKHNLESSPVIQLLGSGEDENVNGYCECTILHFPLFLDVHLRYDLVVMLAANKFNTDR